jgi:hypothetical protein
VNRIAFISILFFFLLIVAACSGTATPVQEGCPSLPTAAVPPLEDIDTAINRWEDSAISRYFVEVEERRQDDTWKVRLVIVDGQIRTAQKLEINSSGVWSDPVVLSMQDAEAYTIPAVLDRLRKDVLGEGPAPVNLKVTFDDNLGYPKVASADAIMFCNPAGEVILNYQYSYDLTIDVGGLQEDAYGLPRDPVLTFIRSGGINAWCDSVRIFPNGTSFHAEECNRDALTLAVPSQLLEELDSLRANFGSLDELREVVGGDQRLTIIGTGQGAPDDASIQAAWSLADQAMEELAEPVGLGLTVVYLKGGQLYGFDIFNQATQSANLGSGGMIYDAKFSPGGQMMAFGDQSGLRLLDPMSGSTSSLLEPPDQGYYTPRLWGSENRLLAAQILAAEENEYQLGWVSIDEKSWHDLPLPNDAVSYGCDTGVSWSPDGDRLAIGGLGYGAACYLSPGLLVVDISPGTVELIVDLDIDAGDGGNITAGVYTPSWSPGGEWIAFGLDQPAKEPSVFPTQLYLVHPDGSQLTQLTNNEQGMAAFPVWSSDGMLYYSLNGVTTSLDGIYEYDPQADSHALLIAGSGLYPLSISPDGQFLIYAQDGGLVIWGFARQEIVPIVSGDTNNPATFSGWMDLSNQSP